MKVLIVHNTYQHFGGEDTAVAAETQLIEGAGHRVVRYQRDNSELKRRGPFGLLHAGAETVWASESHRQIAQILAQEKPDVAHFHNTFPLISPSAYYACADAKVPVVQTLHNYRLLCPAATFLRNGRVCEECLSRSVPWPSVLHACYRESRLATAATAGMLAVHRAIRTWNRKVDTYLAPSEFARKTFIAGGLPEERIVVKPNFLYSDPGVQPSKGEYVLFVGRLSEEKGVRILAAAWDRLRIPVTLVIAGDGPLRSELEQKLPFNVKLLGTLTHEGVLSAMRDARFLVFPSIWFENLPMTIIEVFACGIPVIASHIGALPEIVEDGTTGLHFNPADPDDLASKIEWACSHVSEMCQMGKAARAEYEAKYTAEKNYQMLMQIYERAINGTA